MGRERRWSDAFTGRRLLFASLVLGGAGLVYVFAFSKSEVIYSRNVDEILREWERFAGDERRVRVEGALVAGSLVRFASCEYRFRLEAKGKEILVRVPRDGDGEDCPELPDTFCDRPGGVGGISADGYVERTPEGPSFVAEHVRMKYFRIDETLPPCFPIPLAR